ncbi:MAG: GAF domain-containing protein [Anaerolineae bacterium]|nr:GAF domain-containing protein [Anaerolineae bacterium]
MRWGTSLMIKHLNPSQSLRRTLSAVENTLKKGAKRLPHSALLIVLFALVLFFSVFSNNHFASPENFLLIMMRTAPLAIIVAGQSLVVITGGIDLSVGSVAALTSIIAATLISAQPDFILAPHLAIIAALLVATAIGWGHGWLITHGGLSPFIVTFGSMSLIKGLALVYSNASPITIPHGIFTWMWRLDGALLPFPILLLVLVFVGMSYVLHNTKLGRYAYVIGSNETVAQMSGVKVSRYKTQVYALSGLLAGLSGILLMTRIESGAYTIGESYALTSLAAVVIGGISLQGGSGGVWGALLGVLLLTTINNGLSTLSVSPLWTTSVTGGLILVAAFVDVKRRKHAEGTPIAHSGHQQAKAGSYLFQMYTYLKQAVAERLACENFRLYVVDQETGDLIQQGDTPTDQTIIDQQGHLAAYVKRTQAPLWIDDRSQEEMLAFEPIKPQLLSAIAIPITHIDRVVGVLEVQSPYTGVFNTNTAQQLIDLTREIASPIENAWLLDSGWLLRHTRDALRHLWDEVYLGKCPLALWLYPPHNVPSLVRGGELQRFLLDVIDTVRDKEAEDHARERRQFQVLHLTYIEGLPIETVTEQLSISRRQYFYDQKDALETLVHAIINHQIEPGIAPARLENG